MAIGPAGRLIGMDRDLEALQHAESRLRRFKDQMKLIHGNFGDLARWLTEHHVSDLDAALFDLGVSSLQLEKADRGFSFAREGPLDMRMDPSQDLTAAEVVNRGSVPELADLLKSYGQERWALRIARAIVRGRPFNSTTELAQAIRKIVPPAARHGRIDSATRSFQAIRIWVNQELDLLPQGLRQAIDALRPTARVAVLSYHSLEDRIVKTIFREEQKAGRCQGITRKPIRPSEEEIQANPRARSAMLRIAAKAPG